MCFYGDLRLCENCSFSLGSQRQIRTQIELHSSLSPGCLFARLHFFSSAQKHAAGYAAIFVEDVLTEI